MALSRLKQGFDSPRERQPNRFCTLHTKRGTAHSPIGTGRLRARRRFGYGGEQIGHLRDQSGRHVGARQPLFFGKVSEEVPFDESFAVEGTARVSMHTLECALNAAGVCQKEIPRERGIRRSVQRNNSIRMMCGIRIPTSQSRIGMCFPFSCPRHRLRLSATRPGPGTVAETAALGSSEACAEGSDQERGRETERKLRRRLSGRIEIGLGLRYNYVDAPVGIGLTETGACGKDL